MIKKKKDTIKSLATHEKDVGSTEVQIVFLPIKSQNYRNILKILKKINTQL